jgi:hypothetical protein
MEVRADRPNCGAMIVRFFGLLKGCFEFQNTKPREIVTAKWVNGQFLRTVSTSTDKRHVRCHDRHELHIGLERQARHETNSLRNVGHRHHWFDRNRAVGLAYTALHPGGHFGVRIADIDLPTSNVVLATVQ